MKTSRSRFKFAYLLPASNYRRRGAASVEYAMMMGLITVVLVSTVQEVGSRMRSSFDRVLSGDKGSQDSRGQSLFSNPPAPSPMAIPPYRSQ